MAARNARAGKGATSRRATSTTKAGAKAARAHTPKPSKSGSGASASGKRKQVPLWTDGERVRDVVAASSGTKMLKTEQADAECRSSVTENAVPLSADVVSKALAELLSRRPSNIRSLMQRWEKVILNTAIPGPTMFRQMPTKEMLASATRKVLKFYAQEEALGEESHVAKAFYVASGEKKLRFDWPIAMARIKRASFDMHQEIDDWEECFAMGSGETNSTIEIYVCGTKAITLSALTSVLCHEGLHNMARRVRPGNSYLAEDMEHIAMALLGDPQLVHVSDAP